MINNNKIKDYEQVKEIMQEFVNTSKIRREDNLGISKYELPIEHYTLGNGSKEIVITGATHGSEIISTDFVLKLMQEMIKNDGRFANIDLSEYKFHFIPMLNPEGYLISTFAVRNKIPREMNSKEAEKVCKEYYQAYRQDDINAINRKNQGLNIDRTTLKEHQKMFADVDYKCIPEKYAGIRESVKKIYDKYPDIPKGTIQIWSGNADGIDVQANCEYNPQIKDIQENKTVYKDNLRHSNIDISHPGPINCPYDVEKGFEKTEETKSISNLLESLQNKGTLMSYYNYHSTGGVIYQRPGEILSGIKKEMIENQYGNLDKKTITNYLLSKLYTEKTYKNAESKGKTQYKIHTGKAPISSSNDIFRLKYPENLLIELSGMGGNPIAPYGDIEGNYTNLMESNLDAFAFSIEAKELAQKVASASYNVITTKLQSKKDNEEEVKNRYDILDIIYDEFYRKIEQLKNIKKSNIQKSKVEGR